MKQNLEQIQTVKTLLFLTYVARFVLGNSKATENKYSENVIKDYTYDPNDGGTVGQAVFTNEKSDYRLGHCKSKCKQ
ncbi:MAG: hypothetical protein ACLUD0_06370 [Eubacterium ramulus]